MCVTVIFYIFKSGQLNFTNKDLQDDHRPTPAYTGTHLRTYACARIAYARAPTSDTPMSACKSPMRVHTRRSVTGGGGGWRVPRVRIRVGADWAALCMHVRLHERG